MKGIALTLLGSSICRPEDLELRAEVRDQIETQARLSGKSDFEFASAYLGSAVCLERGDLCGAALLPRTSGMRCVLARVQARSQHASQARAILTELTAEQRFDSRRTISGCTLPARWRTSRSTWATRAPRSCFTSSSGPTPPAWPSWVASRLAVSAERYAGGEGRSSGAACRQARWRFILVSAFPMPWCVRPKRER